MSQLHRNCASAVLGSAEAQTILLLMKSSEAAAITDFCHYHRGQRGLGEAFSLVEGSPIAFNGVDVECLSKATWNIRGLIGRRGKAENLCRESVIETHLILCVIKPALCPILLSDINQVSTHENLIWA